MFKSTIFIFAIMLSVSVFAQEKPFTSTQNKKADKLFNQALENFTLQNYGEAVNLCKKALDLDVNYIDAHMLLADLYEKNEQDEKAQELYAKLVNVNPNFPLSYLGLASYMYAVGNYDR